MWSNKNTWEHEPLLRANLLGYFRTSFFYKACKYGVRRCNVYAFILLGRQTKDCFPSFLIHNFNQMRHPCWHMWWLWKAHSLNDFHICSGSTVFIFADTCEKYEKCTSWKIDVSLVTFSHLQVKLPIKGTLAPPFQHNQLRICLWRASSSACSWLCSP